MISPVQATDQPLIGRLVLIAVVLATVLPSAGSGAQAKQATRIVFSAAVVQAEGDYDWQVYSVLPSGRGLAQLTFASKPATNPLPSPDGRLILFTRGRELWVMQPDGRRQRRLARDMSEPAWLPDSRRVAYVTEDGIRTIGVDGKGGRLVLRLARSPAWSADGRSMAYAHWAPDRVDVRVRRNGREWPIAERSGFEKLALSPDGRWIAVSGEGDSDEVYRFDGRRSFELGIAENPAWSPGGRLLAFVGEQGVEVLNVATGARRVLRSHRFSRLRSIAWSPAGNEIAYTFGYPEEPAEGMEAVSLAGRVRRVPAPVGVVGSVAWSSVPSGVRFRPPLPRTQVVGDELRHRTTIGWLDADGETAAYVDCGEIPVWLRVQSRVVSIPARVATSCNRSGTRPFLYSFALAQDRVAVGYFSGGTGKSASLEAWSSDGSGLEVASSFVTGGDPRGVVRVGQLVGDGDLLVFSSWAFCNEVGWPCSGVPVEDERILATWVWRVRDPTWGGRCPRVRAYAVSTEPGPCQELTVESGPLVPLDADDGRVVAAGDNAVVLLDSNGTRVLSIPVRALAAQLSGSDLVLLVQGSLRHYDVGDGSLLHAWPLPDVASGEPCGPTCGSRRLRLEDLSRGLVVYLLDDKAHLLRLSDGADVDLADAVSTRFGSTGLFYAYKGPYPWRGRIRYVPFDRLPLR